MTIATVDDLLTALRDNRLLEPRRLDDLQSRVQPQLSDPRLLAKEILKRNWLTAYQLNQVFQGRAPELRLGQYLLLERLGEGGMGQVFKATHVSLERTVALKVIRKERLADPNALRRFKREAQAISQLAHPNIVAAFDADSANGVFFLAMEFVEGTDLGRLVKEHGPLSIVAACDCIRQAALGLQHAAERGLVHRDIKPSNLLLQPDLTPAGTGKRARLGIVKILDLGLALLDETDQDEQSGTLTREGSVMGTPDFIAPEQARNSHSVDSRADLYSLGASFFYVLTGRVPFPGGTLTEKLLKHQLDPPPSARALRSDVPEAVDAVVRRLMAKRPEDRYQSPAELAVVLTELATGGPTVVLPAVVTAPPVLGTGTESTPNLDFNTETFLQTQKRTKTPPIQLPWKWIGIGGGALVALALLLFVVSGRKRAPAPAESGSITASAQLTAAVGFDALRRPASAEGLPDDVVAVLGAAVGRQWSSITALAVHPDGTILASAGTDGSIRIWDASNLRERSVLRGHTGTVSALAFSTDGKTLVSAGHDRTVRVWTRTGELWKVRATLVGHQHWVTSVAFAPGGTKLASGSLDGTVRVWDLTSTEPTSTDVLEGHEAGVTAVAYSPDGKHLAAAGRDQLIALWTISFIKHRRRLGVRVEGRSFTTVAFSPDGRSLLAGDDEGSVVQWDDVFTRKANRRSLLPAADSPVRALVCSPDGKTLLAARSDGSLWHWHAPAASPKADLLLERGPSINASAFALDGRTFVVGGEDQTLHRWDLSGATPVEKPVGAASPFYSRLALSKDDRFLAGVVGAGVELRECVGPEPDFRSLLPLAGETVAGLAFAGDELVVLSTTDEGSARLRRRGSDKLHEWELFTDLRPTVFALLAAPDGAVLAAGSRGYQTIRWRNGHETAIATPATEPGPITAAAYAPDAASLLLGDDQGAVHNVSLSHQEPTPRAVECHETAVTALAIAGDGTTRASGALDGTIRLWRPRDADSTGTMLKGHSGAVHSLAFNADGSSLASAGADGRLLLWGVHSKEQRRGWQLGGPVKQVRFAQDGRHLVCLNGNGTIWVIRLGLTHR